MSACVVCKVTGPGKVVTYPWASGLRVEEIEAYLGAEGFSDGNADTKSLQRTSKEREPPCERIARTSSRASYSP